MINEIDELEDTGDYGGDLPTGSAKYAGYLLVEEINEEFDTSYAAIGELIVDTDFDEETVSVNADDFFELDVDQFNESDDDTSLSDLDGTAISGSFTGNIEYDENDSVTGSLTKLSGEEATYTFTSLDAVALGEDASHFGIQNIENGISEATGRDEVDAGILGIAERQ
ncbi:MAG: hypothetical protein ABJT31_11415 [Hyphomicrobiales bacterium]